MKICLSIAPHTMEEALRQLHAAGKETDLVELRIDGIYHIDLRRLLQKPRPHVIITNRTVIEGGKFNGSAIKQIDIMLKAIDYGAEYVDIEMSWGPAMVHKLISLKRSAKIIVSSHNFKETPRNLNTMYDRMKSTNADVIKIATMAKDVTDCKRMFTLLDKAHQDRQHMIGICMGEQGEITRILGGAHNSFLTFASLKHESATAPGQRSIEDVRKIFHAETINRRTNVFGLIGNPVSHSKGIYYHNSIFKRKNINAVYVNFLTNDVKNFLKFYKDDIAGASVTMPFKESIVPFLDKLEGDAETLQTVNTILHHREKLIGYTTDLPAVIQLLRPYHLKNKHVTVLGTGGTAKTMAFAAISSGARTTIAGRSLEKTKALARELGSAWATFDDWTNIPCDVLMNGTPIVMSGHEPGEFLFPKNYFHKKMVVLDAVYLDHLTPLLQLAQSKGSRIITGAELFQRQAQLQSRLFQKSIA